MAYVSDSLYRLARTSRHMAILTGCLGALAIAFVLAGDGPSQQIETAIRIYLATSIVPALLLFALSFPVERGKLWAAPALIVVCVGQVPGIVFCGGCVGILPSAYLLARCLVAWPEIMFQIRAARRERSGRARGFDPLPTMTTTTGGATQATAPSRVAGAAMIAPKSLKPSTRRREDPPEGPNVPR